MQVHLLVRGAKMRASAAMQDRVLNHEKVEVHFSTEVADAFGDKKGLKGLQLRDTSSGWCCDPSFAQRRLEGKLLTLHSPCFQVFSVCYRGAAVQCQRSYKPGLHTLSDTFGLM